MTTGTGPGRNQDGLHKGAQNTFQNNENALYIDYTIVSKVQAMIKTHQTAHFKGLLFILGKLESHKIDANKNKKHSCNNN